MAFFGVHGIINIITLLVGAVMFLLAAIFRKNVANDSLDMGFSLFGSTFVGIVVYIITSNLIALKWAILISLAAYFGAGFLIGNNLGDGDADG